MNNELKHYGVLGMKWGVRRYQNKDGSLTKAGQIKYRAKESDSSVTKKVKEDLSKMTGKEFKQKYQVSNTTYMKRVDKFIDPYMNSPLAKLGKKLKKNKNNKIREVTNNAEQRMKKMIKGFEDKFVIETNKDGSVYLKSKDGKETWKVN